MTQTLRILVDADACPVKEEIYKVAWRLDVPVTLVSNQHLRIPQHPLVDKVVVGSGSTPPTTGSPRRAAPRRW